ncbi:hypothetical protein LNTAR_24893 [Lentisphaera araneosa HTCC2155]|jgi:hypothetical protein|uniref:Uncharacterized protein n=1 Tax=Lentisphaera araneosa HTCC2155 TaxID=313628 RepID=A6DSY6_9BACT|nr:hypothetical protein [Lentisphaera araneosa]EDM25276.1 hypothetical protein LNTAR_24893 [Lentisphaera araneosa HTCC2155]
MNKKLNRNKIILISVLIITLWTFRPYSKPNMEKVHPSLSSLETPYKDIQFSYWQDGGSVGISITDSKDKTAHACIPRPMGEEDEYKDKIYLGSSHYSDDNSYELEGYSDTKIFLTNLLRNATKQNRFIDIECVKSSRRLRDWFTLLWRRFTKDDSYQYNENF